MLFSSLRAMIVAILWANDRGPTPLLMMHKRISYCLCPQNIWPSFQATQTCDAYERAWSDDISFHGAMISEALWDKEASSRPLVLANALKECPTWCCIHAFTCLAMDVKIKWPNITFKMALYSFDSMSFITERPACQVLIDWLFPC